MNLSQKQKGDLVTIGFFIPREWDGTVVEDRYKCIYDENGEEPEKIFFDFSDRGISPRGRKTTNRKRVEQLFEGKRRRGMHMGMWEEGVKGEKIKNKKTGEIRYIAPPVPYFVLLGGENGEILPDEVVEFMSKEMFKGLDREKILQTHAQIKKQLNERNTNN